VAQLTAFYDVWLVSQNLVYKQVPFHVVTDWIQQSRVRIDDQLKPTGTPNWAKVNDSPLFKAYVSKPQPAEVEARVPLEPIELDFEWKKSPADEDDDVDMIPLIDISLVLLIFFMMTATVATISRISVPEVVNGAKLDANAGTITIEIDLQNERVVYGIAFGNAAPSGEFAALTEGDMFLHLDTHLAGMSQLATITIAAHKDLTYEQVDKIMAQIEKRREDGALIGRYNVQVGQKARS
jgi:biopolymer transport protein ExbD